MLNFMKENLWLVIGLAALLLIIITVIVVLLVKKEKKVKVAPVDNVLLEAIYQALGTENISSVAKEQDRVKFIVKDVKVVNAKVFTDNKIPAFLKGNEIKILYRNYSNELYNYIFEKVGK